MSTPSVTPYVPFDASKYVRQSDLSKIELSIFESLSPFRLGLPPIRDT